MSDKPCIVESPEWRALQDHAKAMDGVHMRDLFAQDNARFKRFHTVLDGVVFDYSKHRITDNTLALLMELAASKDLEGRRDAMFSGEVINTTEDRRVLHTALRGDCPPDLDARGENVSDFVTALRTQMQRISDDIRNDATVDDVIHIGVGGSDLGPRLVCEALRAKHSGPRLHFLGNIDGQSAQALLAKLDPQRTVVLVASKTFTTLETMANAELVKAWMIKGVGEDQYGQRFYAMSAAVEKAQDFGVPADHILPMRDWIGGRFSVWSSIGLPIAIAFGFDDFMAFLDGAASVDTHFKTAPLHQNIPVLMGMLGVWYRNFWGCHAHAVLPYADSLALLPTYMQQLDMESNGKGATGYHTGAIVFGGAGTGMQHAFMQSLHQGTDIVPCDFIIAAHNPHAPDHFQQALNANALAQAQALMLGKPNEAEPHRHFEGNRPSSSLVVPELNARTLGMLLAMYEHKIFVQGIVWGINSFDQWGVELGKVLAKDIIDDFDQGRAAETHDSSTEGLIRVILG